MDNLFDDEEEYNEQAEYQRKFDICDQLIDAGFAVFEAAVYPKADGTLGKIPLTPHGHLDASRDKQLMRQVLINPRWHPPGLPSEYETVVAFVPGSGNCGVLDCDIKHGKQGDKSYNQLVQQYGGFAYSAWATPSGGANILFKKPADVVFSNRSPWVGIDVRADNGWCVAPGNKTRWGTWDWVFNTGPTTAKELPPAMLHELKPSSLNGQRSATPQQAIDFIEASPHNSAPQAQFQFAEQIKEFQQATTGSRHDALVKIAGWTIGMEHLDLRWAILQIKTVWEVLISGEGREDEVTEVIAWVIGQELPKRIGNPNHQEPNVSQLTSTSPGTSHSDFWLTFEDDIHDDDIIEGLIIPGRWLQMVAPSKQGKSSLLLWTAIELAEGRHPYDGSSIPAVSVAYCDGEMGYSDLQQLITDCGHNPAALVKGNLHCTIEHMRLDSDLGAGRLLYYADEIKAKVVILDGLNGFINPDADENASPTWTALFERCIIPLKRRGIAVISGDNLGKDVTKGVRGHSSKTDKADAVMKIRLTENGTALTLTHGRAGAYLDKLELNAEGFDRSKPIRYWLAQNSWLHGTAEAALVLDQLQVPTNLGRDKVRVILRDAAAKGIRITNHSDPNPFAIRNDVLSDAIRYRKAGLQQIINSTTTQQTP